MHCSKCGNQIKKEWKHCPKCGTKSPLLAVAEKPTEKVVEEEQPAVINLRRPSQHWFRFRRFGIFIDSKKMGKISNGGEERFEVQPGKHSMYVDLDWMFKSKELTFDLYPGETVNLTCGSSSKGAVSGLMLGVFSAFKPGMVLHLKQE